MERWLLRLVLAGIPLAVGVYLLVTGRSMYGVLAIVASALVLLLVLGVEWVLSRFGRAFDSATNPRIVESGGRRLQAAIERGDASSRAGPSTQSCRATSCALCLGGNILPLPLVSLDPNGQVDLPFLDPLPMFGPPSITVYLQAVCANSTLSSVHFTNVNASTLQ